MTKQNDAPLPDEILFSIADYVKDYEIDSEEAYETARACFADSLACAMLALDFPQCTKLLGPVVPGTIVPGGCRIPGTDYVLDPIRGAFTLGMMIRWLDYNDTWLAAEWGHPSDNLGGILALADFLSQKEVAEGKEPWTLRQVLTAMIKAHEIQGVLALENSFNRVGLDHVILVKVATAAVATGMLGGSRQQIADAVSQAWVDAGPLRTYRHSPNTGSRKSWAAGDATARGVQLAWMTMQGEKGYATGLSASNWGFYDVLFKGKEFKLARPFGSYVMENVLFKISFPAEFHAQTAVEAAIHLHPQVKGRWDAIQEIVIETHESAVRIIDKTGPLHNPADRDHCLQYMVAIPLLKGSLVAEDYEDDVAADARIDALRAKMTVVEEKRYSEDYLNPELRSIANAITVCFKDGSQTERIEVEYPVGHRRRRDEGIPLLFQKCQDSFALRYPLEQVKEFVDLFGSKEKFESAPVDHFCAAAQEVLQPQS